jgi:hypothetical protein
MNKTKTMRIREDDLEKIKETTLEISYKTKKRVECSELMRFLTHYIEEAKKDYIIEFKKQENKVQTKN